LYTAGQIHVLISQQQQASHVTLYDVIAALRQLVLVRQCDVFAYLSVDNQLILLLAAITDTPSQLQV